MEEFFHPLLKNNMKLEEKQMKKLDALRKVLLAASVSLLVVYMNTKSVGFAFISLFFSLCALILDYL
jgi:RNAse (barnase) inhibitor barstar